MANDLGNGLKDIFLAGVGAMALTGEKAKETVDKLIAKGELSVEQGKAINQELSRKASDTMSEFRGEALSQFIERLSPEDRKAFADQVAKLTAEQGTAEDAAKTDNA